MASGFKGIWFAKSWDAPIGTIMYRTFGNTLVPYQKKAVWTLNDGLAMLRGEKPSPDSEFWELSDTTVGVPLRLPIADSKDDGGWWMDDPEILYRLPSKQMIAALRKALPVPVQLAQIRGGLTHLVAKERFKSGAMTRQMSETFCGRGIDPKIPVGDHLRLSCRTCVEVANRVALRASKGKVFKTDAGTIVGSAF